MPAIRKTLTIVLFGTSLTTGKLEDWSTYLVWMLQQYPEAKGPIRIINMGKGGQTSAWGIANVGPAAAQKPDIVLTEGFGINDSAVIGGVPQVSQAQHITNLQGIVAAFRAVNPAVKIIIQTMSPVSAAGAALRPNLANYYADEITQAGVLATDSLDNYAGWVKPLPLTLSHFNDPAAAVFGSGCTLNPAAKGANVTLSNANLTAAAPAAAGVKGAVRSTFGVSTGRTSFSISVNALGPVGLGVVQASTSLEQHPGGAAGGIGVFSDGSIWRNASQFCSLGAATPPWAIGDVVSIDVDWVAALMWINYNNNWVFGGDPIAGVGGLPLVTAAQYFFAVGVENGGQVTADFATAQGDGLHPIYTGGQDTYLMPNVITKLRAAMATFWP